MPATLAFVPGTMCDRRVWEPVWRELGGRLAIAYVPIETQLTRSGMRALFEAAGSEREPLNLVAFSMGGYLALEYALDRPGHVRSLVLVCSSAFGLKPEEKAERSGIVGWLEKNDYRGMTTSRLNQFVHPSRRDDPAVAGVMRDMDRDLGKEVLLAQMRETTARVSLENRLPDLRCPALFIGADTDPFVAPADVARMAQFTPNARTAIAQQTGHMIPLEQPHWLAAQIEEFQKSLR